MATVRIPIQYAGSLVPPSRALTDGSSPTTVTVCALRRGVYTRHALTMAADAASAQAMTDRCRNARQLVRFVAPLTALAQLVAIGLLVAALVTERFLLVAIGLAISLVAGFAMSLHIRRGRRAVVAHHPSVENGNIVIREVDDRAASELAALNPDRLLVVERSA